MARSRAAISGSAGNTPISTSKFQISITAEDGVVTLAGLIDQGQEAKHAADVARQVPGVRDVALQLRVALALARTTSAYLAP